MTTDWKIRPLLWSAMSFAFLGSIVGGYMAMKAVTELGDSAKKIGQFERAWSYANIIDIKASDAAKVYALSGDESAISTFNSVKDQRAEALLDAIEIAPTLENETIFSRTYETTVSMADIERIAIEFAQNGKKAEALQMLSSPRYAQLGSAKNRFKEQARGQLVASLENQIDDANASLINGLLAMVVGLLLGAFFWWRVGRLFKNQAVELKIARDALAAHAESLEEKIEARTRDLEKAKKAAEAADYAKSSFLAQMSHEIRTPMNGVLGMAQALAQTNLDDRQMRLLGVIQESGDTLLALLNDVLDLAKIEAGRMDIEMVDFNVCDIVRSAEAIFSTRAHDKGLSFAVEVSNDADVWCIGDPTRLRQILYNLMSNAIKFTNEGEVKVMVTGNVHGENEINLQFKVSDTGIGMDEDGVSRLFQRFSQADTDTTRKFGGSGLGLAICKELAHLMGGDITVESVKGKGTTFTFSLQAAIGQEPEQTNAADFNQAFESEENGVELRILAAEDNANNRLVLKMFLEQVGITPTFVENGRLAVEAWQSQEFDIILMDVQMPEMSGPEASKEIRRLEKEAKRKRTPIIALTANAMTHHVHECLQSGMDAHVAKPIRPDLLFAAIDRLVATESDEIAIDDIEFEEIKPLRALK